PPAVRSDRAALAPGLGQDRSREPVEDLPAAAGESDVVRAPCARRREDHVAPGLRGPAGRARGVARGAGPLGCGRRRAAGPGGCSDRKAGGGGGAVMKSRLALGCAALLVFECVGAAWATNGGPELTEVLGWDPAEGKVFFRTHYVDETDRPPGIFYLNLKGKDPSRLERVAWSREDFPDSVYEGRVRRL